MVDKELAWTERISAVFRSRPRIGCHSDTFWLNRPDIERGFKKHLITSGTNVCLDGPTGTGKSSLALTMLDRLQIPFTQVQVTNHMDWKTFCRAVIDSSKNRESSVSAELLASITGIVPKGSLKVSVGRKGRPSDELEYLDKKLANCAEADVCSAIALSNGALVVDDFEKAGDDLVVRVADMCKLLTQTYESELGKLVIVGTGDIFARLYEGDPALEERLKQFSLGTLPDSGWSWKYLQVGFEKLGLWHPGNSKYGTPEDRSQCQQEVYKACDGLFKGLTALGQDICNAISPETKGIKAGVIIETAREVPARNYRSLRRRFPEIFRCVEDDPIVRATLQYLYERGIGRIHDWNELLLDMKDQYDEAQIENAVCELVDVRMLVRTGRNGDTLYVTDPRLAHTLGVVVTHPNDFDIPKKYATFVLQLRLPFKGKEDDYPPDAA